MGEYFSCLRTEQSNDALSAFHIFSCEDYQSYHEKCFRPNIKETDILEPYLFKGPHSSLISCLMLLCLQKTFFGKES